MNSFPTNAGRDTVCVSIESLLRDLEAEGYGTLESSKIGGSVRLTFGDIRVEAISYDIGLVRLATAMMDDQRYCAMLMGALRGPMLASR